MTLSLPGREDVWMQHYTSLAVFLLGAIALVVPSGYSIGAVLLLLGSAWLLVSRPALALNRQDAWVIAALVLYTLVGLLEVWWDGQGSRGMDKPIRFLLAVPALLLIMAFPPRLAFLWGGLAVGAIASGSWAGWQKLVQGVWRADGHTYVIQFGNLNMLMGVLCLAGLGWAVVQPRRSLWVGLLALGAIAGILGSLFSGSRGGWIGFPLVLLVLYRGYGRQLPAVWKVGMAAFVLLGATLAYSLPQTGVQPRVNEAVSDVTRYFSGESQTTSVGARFEMWKGAAHLITERPLTGWGNNGYRQRMQELGEEGVIHPGVTIYGHAHNEFIDAFAKRGVIGLAVLLALYLIPLRLFSKNIASRDLSKRSVAVAGMLLSVAYIDFGLSQVFLAHNSGVMMFAFWLAVLWGVTSRMNKQTAGK
ncbi:O-antigen ligase family protein [Halomonas daqingensis]|uniref:O-antigen ligase family protein n=2 Tax=Billgrantia desiderata TaxID=52021 RepID=A0AAW4YQX4_9GAMM|nr:O-antigen ligase family protein [Halomonas desiderata]MCE8050720.1 O-antigen ligase family protein [Halomonas desiderata]